MFQVNRDDVAFVCVPVLSDPDKKRNLYLEIETRLVCYILQEKHNHFLEKTQNSIAPLQNMRSFLKFSQRFNAILLLVNITFLKRFLANKSHALLLQPSNYEEFSSRLDDPDTSRKQGNIALKSELVRVDVSGKSFARMTDYRR